MDKPILYGPFKELVAMHGLPLHGPLKDEELPVIKDGGIVVEEGTIVDIGDYKSLKISYKNADHLLFGEGPLVAVPAFVDCHTHICWAGNRTNDYALRMTGASYLEIAKSGGGIMETVRATRLASEEELVSQILKRAEKLLSLGIATVEIKSGYGLTKEDELKMLRAIKTANNLTPLNLIPTFLGAHIKPVDFEGTVAEYLKALIEETIPIILEEDLAERADIFVEEGAFPIEAAREYAQTMQEAGLMMTMHVDQFGSGGAVMAIDCGCVSADHLENLSFDDLSSFANSKTVAVALPGASLGLGMKFTPCRQLLDSDACLAIASDWNPGSAPMGDLLTQAALLGASEKLTISETLAAITYRAAQALRVDAGMLHISGEAKFTVFSSDDYRNIFYKQGQLRPKFTVIGNECIEH